MSALANHAFVKMNGLGNEIVVVDMREQPAPIGAGRRARGRAARRRALRPAHGALAAALAGHRRLRPHLQQRRLGGRRLRQRHALRRASLFERDRQDSAHVRDRRRPAQLLAGRRRPIVSPSTWACRASAGTRFRWPRNSATPARSNCRSGRSTSRSCIRRRWSAWAIRTRSSGSTTSNAYDLAASGRCWKTIRSFPSAPTSRSRSRLARRTSSIRTWERGAGLTKACGSAACAAAVAAARLQAHRPQGRRVTLPGGDLVDRMARERRPRADDRPGRVRIRGHASIRRCSRERQACSMSVDVVTFGCRLNAYESEVIRREAEAAGLADAVVVNTCAVTGEAVRAGAADDPQAASRERPEARIVVTGCAAQTEPQTFAAMAEVDRVLGNDEKLQRDAWRDAAAISASTRSEKIARQRHHGGDGDRAASDRRRSTAARAPSCRCRTAATTAAPSASSPTAAAIRARCRWARWSRRCGGWSSNGYREIVLTGVDITSYGADLPGAPKLGTLVKQILRARAGAEAAAAVLDRFDRGRRRSDRRHRRRAAADAASASVAAGRRRHDPEAHEAPPFARRRDRVLRRRCARLRPDIVFGADIIAGFPTETEDDVRALARSRRRMRPDASCMSFRSRRARARRRRACRRSQAARSRSARGGCARRARRRCDSVCMRKSARRATC